MIQVRATCHDGKVQRVAFENVPAFATHLDVPLEVSGFGTITVDIAWGGMWFVNAEAAQFGLDPTAENGAQILRAGEAMRVAAAQQYPVRHPENPDIKGPTISQLTAPPTDPATDGRGAIVISTGSFDPDNAVGVAGVLDRSPCGTGTCAKMAVLHAKGKLAISQDYVNAGPLGTTFTGRIERTTKVGPYEAIIPSLSGRGWITGTTNYMVDPSDPFQSGFTIADIWA